MWLLLGSSLVRGIEQRPKGSKGTSHSPWRRTANATTGLGEQCGLKVRSRAEKQRHLLEGA